VTTAGGQLSSQHQFVSDVLHHLSQPLTALHCSLELSLARDQTSSDFRVSLQAALRNTECLRQRLLFIRELNDAGESGDTSVPVALSLLLEELREELFPLFESAGKSFEVDLRPVEVRGNRTRLARGFFYMSLFLLRTNGRRVLLAECPATQPASCVELVITATDFPSADRPMAYVPEADSVSEMEIGRRCFEAVGGTLTRVTSSTAEMAWRIQLPIAR
jgi:hypothetical protein